MLNSSRTMERAFSCRVGCRLRVPLRRMGSRFSGIIWSIPDDKGATHRLQKTKGATHKLEGDKQPPIRAGWHWPSLADTSVGCTPARTSWVAPLVRQGTQSMGGPFFCFPDATSLSRSGEGITMTLTLGTRKSAWRRSEKIATLSGPQAEPGGGERFAAERSPSGSLRTGCGAGAWEREVGPELESEGRFL